MVIQDGLTPCPAQTMPPLVHAGLRDCQIIAIENLENSFKDDRPRALVQMATGSGKTYTAARPRYGRGRSPRWWASLSRFPMTLAKGHMCRIWEVRRNPLINKT